MSDSGQIETLSPTPENPSLDEKIKSLSTIIDSRRDQYSWVWGQEGILKKEGATKAWGQTLARIRQETGFLTEYLDYFDYQEFRWGFGDWSNIDGRVRSWRNTLSPNTGGEAHIVRKEAALAGPPPTLEDIWISIAENGKVPDSVLKAYHEIIHLQQGLFCFSMELAEAQAYRTANCPDADPRWIYQTMARLGIYPGLNQEKFLYAVDAIDRLKGLGVSNQSISQIINGVQIWHTDHFFPLEGRINRIMRQKSFTPEGLTRAVTDLSKSRTLDSLMAQNIAQEEIVKFLEPKSI